MRQSKRGNLDDHYKKQEAEQSGRLGKKVFARYQKGSGIKYLFDRHNKKILGCILDQNGTKLKHKYLLEIGCGFGDFLYQAREIVDIACGIDISFEQVKMGSTRQSMFKMVADAEFLPFSNDSFDYIVMKGIIHHLGDPSNVFNEVRRVLNRNGSLVIVEGNPSSWYRKIILGIADFLRIEHESSFFPHLDANQIINILSSQKFSVKHKFISGLFAPLGLIGFGGGALWDKLNKVEDLLEKNIPLFSWYNLFIATNESKWKEDGI